MNTIFLIILGIISTCFLILIGVSFHLLTKNKNLKEELETYLEEIESKDASYSKLLSQKKSSEVRLGFIAEKLAPFLDDFTWNPGKLIFAGQPIDYIHFGTDEITFIEVKSGKSKLSTSQRKIQKLIKNGNVKFEIFRI